MSDIKTYSPAFSRDLEYELEQVPFTVFEATIQEAQNACIVVYNLFMQTSNPMAVYVDKAKGVPTQVEFPWFQIRSIAKTNKGYLIKGVAFCFYSKGSIQPIPETPRSGPAASNTSDKGALANE